MFSYCIGRLDGDEIKVDIYRLDASETERKRGIEVLQRFFNDTTIEKVGHNIKFDLKFARHLGIKIPRETVIHDTMIMSQLQNNLAPSHGLKEIMWRLRGTPRDTEKAVRQMAAARGGYHRVPDHIMRKYQFEDGENALLLALLWLPKLKKEPKVWADYRNEMDLIWHTIRMEEFGLMLDIREARKTLDWLEEELHQINQRCLALFGSIPNLNSAAEVNYHLYKKLKLPVLEYTAGGAPSADKDVILKLREEHYHPFLDDIIKQRSYTKGVAMLSNYMEHADSSYIIHPNIKTNEARTGRQASDNPPLQNVAKQPGLKTPFAVPLRRVFRCHPGHVMPLCDYAAIELRLIIDRAGEQSWIDLLKNHGDPHNEAGAVWFGDWVRPELRWSARADKAARKPLRDAGKNATFGKGYGAGLPKIAATLGLSLDEAKPGFDTFCRTWPKVAYFTNISAKKVLEQGYVETPFGRKLRVEKGMAHAGANYDIQGTAAGILKRAQVRVGEYLDKHWPEVRMVLPVHDELIFSYPRNLLPYKNEVLKEISTLMTQMAEIKVPLEVEWKQTTTTWADARGIDL